jgi:hypothetical protein
MLNPALLATVTAAAANGYAQATQGALMPWSFSFLVAPLVLHRDTRNALPSTVATHIPTWLERNTTARIGFPERARTLVGVVSEGLRFGLRHRAISIVEGEFLRSELPAPTPARLAIMVTSAPFALEFGSEPGPDFTEIIIKARFVGRWVTKLDSPTTAFALLGVRP